MIVGTLDWALPLAAAIGAVPATLAAIFSALNRREIKTPEGAHLGELVAHTHELAEVATAKVEQIVNGEAEPPHGTHGETGGIPDVH